MDWIPLLLSLKLAFITTLLLFAIGLPLALWLTRTPLKIKFLIESVIALPLVLPPTVIGFYLLVAFSPDGLIGSFFTNYLGLPLLFSFEGLVIGSLLYSLPFMIQPLQAGFEQLPPSFFDLATLYNKSKWEIVTKILIPNSKKSVLSALVLTFAHTIGEFGIVLMIGGKIDGVTKVASVAIYDEVETLQYAAANQYATILLLLSFMILSITYYINRRDVAA